MIRRRPPRIRRATGIYEDRHGNAIVVGGKEHRYPLGTSLDELLASRKALLLEHAEKRSGAPRGSLDAAIAAHLLTLPEGPRRRDEAALLRHWSAVLGRRMLGDITATEIRAFLALWQTTTLPVEQRPGYFVQPKPGTLRHLRRALGAVYRTRYGAAGINPTRDVPRPRVYYDEARDMPRAVIEAIFAQIPDQGRPDGSGTRPIVSFGKLRLRAMAETGWNPAMLKQLTPRMVDLDAATAMRPTRRKGRGVASVRVGITPEAVDALRSLFASGAPQTFQTRSLSATWRRAVVKAKARWGLDHPRTSWPAHDDVRPYDLRHTFGAEAFAASGDVQTVAELLGHADLNTTRRYTRGAVSARVQQAVAAIAHSRATKNATMTVRRKHPKGSAKHHIAHQSGKGGNRP